ncbi:MAG: sigma-54-dependent Fis family transcriptional regulator [Candidatus Eisenbacteria bacterium]|uniref:Sigma-54-dependent Fis family transcriptional regulator n=1 Tax=Eiseniibacteriota bacterium TaxID=2212470 RepID=A0A956NAG4_UNCEI|nr:sigma-54-dependent Fis family transcriptional regulator [Candidatus Eisenbacteria bacterium]
MTKADGGSSTSASSKQDPRTKRPGRLTLFVVDDETAQREILVDILSDEGYEVHAFASAKDALAALNAVVPGLVLTDLRMPEMDGLELLAQVKERFPDLPVLLMTAYGSVSSAVAAMKHGAFDYLQKPFEKDELVQRVRRVAERDSLVRENERLRRELSAQAGPRILGESAVMQKLFRKIERIAGLEGDVLLAGESGTGKELVARALHYAGVRAAGPFVPVNCAAIPEGLAESELFGHEKGAFTHATSERAGRFEQADGGTLFLDEISAMPLPLQAKLLRVLQDRMVERVGSHKPRRVEVRIVAATNRDLPARIAEGTFREDLYHRLNVHELWIPALRDRGDDIVLLAESFRDRAAARFGMPAPDLAPELLSFLRSYDFPGNVRELEHMMEKMVALSDGEPLGLEDLPPSVRRMSPSPLPSSASPPSTRDAGDGADSMAADVSTSAVSDTSFTAPESLLDGGPISLFDVERRLLEEAIRRSGGNLSEAARSLGISYKTMRYRARKFDLDIIP